MGTLFFVFTLLWCDGNVTVNRQQATYMEHHKPVKTMAECDRLAAEMQLRMQEAIDKSKGASVWPLVDNILVRCERGR